MSDIASTEGTGPSPDEEVPLAKSDGRTLRDHMTESGGAAVRLWGSVCPGPRRRMTEGISGDADPGSLAVFLAAVHDVGKASPGFQRMLKGGPAGNLRHAEVSQAVLERLGIHRSVSLVVGSHHGSSPSAGDVAKVSVYRRDSGFGDPFWTDMQDSLVHLCCGMSGLSLEVLKGVRLDVAAQVLLTGFVTLADRYASSGFPEIPPLWQPSADFTFEERFGLEPRPFQRLMMEVASRLSEPGLIILEAPMGEGKTEAALAASEILAARFGSGGVVFALPTHASAEGMKTRAGDWLERTGSPCGELSGFSACTVDQILQMSLRQRHLPVRHLAVAGKVVVIDECHACDAYMGSFLCKTLEWLGFYHVPTILMSATLTAVGRKTLVDSYLRGKGQGSAEISGCGYPLVTYTDGPDAVSTEPEGSGRSLDARIQWDDPSELAGMVSSLPADATVGIFVNTVARAQKMYDLISSDTGRDTVLLHAGFAACDRSAKEKLILERAGPGRDGEGIAVVGTQVIEQSLDLDFDVVFTELCPADLLLQRMGRLHRHPNRRPEGTEEPVCHILDTRSGPLDGGSEAVYGRFRLLRTRQVIGDRVSIPRDVPDLVGRAYGETGGLDDDYRDYELDLKAKVRDSTVLQTVSPTRMRDISGWTDAPSSPQKIGCVCGSAVRDSEPSVRVIPVVCEYGCFRLLPWVDGGREIPSGPLPDDIISSLVGCVLALPYAVSFKNPGKVVRSMTEQNVSEIPREWGMSPRLAKELFLVLNKDLEGRAAGRRIEYTLHRGLRILDRVQPDRRALDRRADRGLRGDIRRPEGAVLRST